MLRFFPLISDGLGGVWIQSHGEPPFFQILFLHFVNLREVNAFLLNCCNNSLFLQMTLPNYCNVQLQAEKQSTIRQATSCQNAERKNSANAFVVVRLLFFFDSKKNRRDKLLWLCNKIMKVVEVSAQVYKSYVFFFIQRPKLLWKLTLIVAKC